MDWKNYKKRFKIACRRSNVKESDMNAFLKYAEKLCFLNLPIIYDVKHLSLLLGYEEELIFKISNCSEKFYRNFTIPKRNGKRRKIDEPYPTLKEIQKWILENIFQNISVSRFAKAYVPHGKLIDNVRFHKNQNIVIKLDIENFFRNITIQKVFSLFCKLGYNRQLSAILANLCCYKGYLPQGAPTSPYLSNLIALHIDNRISKYVIKRKLRYTRYSDDITISGDLSNSDISSVIWLVATVLQENGFVLKKSKTKVLRKSNQQNVTGIVVNEKLSVKRNVKKAIRQEVYYINKFGLESHISYKNIKQKNYCEHLMGQINWVLTVEKNNKEFLEYKEYFKK